MLRNFNKKFMDAGGNVKKAMQFNHFVNKPLLNGEDNKKVISAANFPELHVLTGIVGKIIKELERKAFMSAM